VPRGGAGHYHRSAAVLSRSGTDRAISPKLSETHSLTHVLRLTSAGELSRRGQYRLSGSTAAECAGRKCASRRTLPVSISVGRGWSNIRFCQLTESKFSPSLDCMHSCSLSEAKSSLGRLADEALKGRPTVIARGGKLLILQAYDPPAPDAFDALIDEGIASEHLQLTDAFWKGVRARGRKLARKAVVK
jgi:hypothetical protein